MHTQMLIRLVVGLGMTAIIALLAVRRVLWLAKLTLSGQPVSGRTDDVGTRVWTQITEVFGQRRLLKWSIPGLAHFFTMWGFFILGTVYVEAYGTLFQNNFHIPIVGRWDALGFLQDFIALERRSRHRHVLDHPVALRTEGVRPFITVLRLPHRRRLADPVHDLHGHLQLRDLPRCVGEHRNSALRRRCFLLPRHGRADAPAGRQPPTSGSRRSRCSPTSLWR